ncbi:MAG TPA: toprim domain-containing protein [Blastocatellia bacterium]|nr:toprim domain-containing protein [Blastocatellia bacterium]
MNASQIGIALKGRRNGSGWLVCCPCPNHGKGRGDRFPSLSVADGDDNRLLLRCFAGCGFIDILDELKHRGLVDGKAPFPPAPTRSKPKPHDPDPEALKIWVASRSLQHSFAAEYLERRGIALQPPSLRCRVDVPALVAGVQRPDGKIVAVQQLRLTNEGEKADVLYRRLTTGALGAGAVRFGPAAEVIGLAEGVETALSAMELSGVTVWASLGSARLHQVELPPEVEEVHVFVDNDEPGRLAAKRAADVHASLGRRVYLRSPPDECGDWNDFLNLIADGRDPLPARSAEDAA